MQTTSRNAEVTFEGRAYSIPEIWLAGFCHHGATIQDAIAWWAYQSSLAEMEDGR